MICVCAGVALVACSGGKTSGEKTAFTKIDSLTETYLTLQDSMLQSWNVMMKDENEKIIAIHELLHAMIGDESFDKSQIITMEQRLIQLERIRFTQKTMANPHLVDEYDFASSSLITEILSLTESNPTFTSSKGLQNLVDKIRNSDQRVMAYRADYDSITGVFNAFLDSNKDYLKEIDENSVHEKRPLFQMASGN